MINPVSTVARRGPPRLSDALEPIASDAGPHQMADPYDIGEALEMLAASGDPVTIHASGASHLLMARIVSVDPELPHFVLELAEGETIAPGPATFVASLGGNAKLQFVLEQDWSALPGQPTRLPAVFPAACQVLNRRAAERLEAPLGIHYTASFMCQNRPYELQLYDFALGGVGMRASPQEAMGLHVGRKLEGVRLELGGQLSMTADLEVRLLRNFRSFLLGDQVQIGCRFLNLPAPLQHSLARLLAATNGGRRRV